MHAVLLPRSATNQNNFSVRSYNLYNQGALASSRATSTAVKTSLLKLISVFKTLSRLMQLAEMLKAE